VTSWSCDELTGRRQAGRSCGRSGGRPYMAVQYGYVQLGRHLVIIYCDRQFFSCRSEMYSTPQCRKSFACQNFWQL